ELAQEPAAELEAHSVGADLRLHVGPEARDLLHEEPQERRASEVAGLIEVRLDLPHARLLCRRAPRAATAPGFRTGEPWDARDRGTRSAGAGRRGRHVPARAPRRGPPVRNLRPRTTKRAREAAPAAPRSAAA